MADDYDLQTLLQLKLIGPEKGDGGWGHLWWMGDRRMVSYGKPFQYTASGILNLPVTSSGTERTAAIIQFGWKADRYDSKALFAIVGIVSWPIGSNVYKPTAAEIKQAQIDEKKRAIQAQIDEKKRLEQAQIDEKNRAIQAQIDEKKRLEQAQIDEKKRLEDEKKENEKILSKTIIIGKLGSGLEVTQLDFTNPDNWANAKIACARLGEGWRLPTKDELNILYQNAFKIGGFSISSYYWSSSDDNDNGAWAQSFNDGEQKYYKDVKTYGCYVRAVRSIDEKKMLELSQIEEKNRIEQAQKDEKNRIIREQNREKKRIIREQSDEKKRVEFKLSVSDENLIAFYDFEFNANDISKNKYDGKSSSSRLDESPFKGVEFSEDRLGNPQGCIKFSGPSTENRIIINFNQNIDFSNRTISFWIKNPQVPQDYYSTIYELKGDISTILGDHPKYVSEKRFGKLSWNCKSQPSWGLESESFLNDDKWHHVVLVTDYDNKKAFIYIDGVRNAIKKSFILENFYSDYLIIGNTTNFDSQTPFVGLLDDFAIWNRALSNEEVSQFYKTQRKN